MTTKKVSFLSTQYLISHPQNHLLFIIFFLSKEFDKETSRSSQSITLQGRSHMKTQAGDSQRCFGASVWTPDSLSPPRTDRLPSGPRPVSPSPSSFSTSACGYFYKLSLVCRGAGRDPDPGLHSPPPSREECPCGARDGVPSPARESPGPPSAVSRVRRQQFPRCEAFRVPSSTASHLQSPGHAPVLPLAAPDVLARLRLFYTWPAEQAVGQAPGDSRP